MGKCLAVTGHRPQKLGGFDDLDGHPMHVWIQQCLAQIVKMAVEKGYDHFVCGAALGVDTWFARIVVAQRHLHPHIRLTLAVPCRHQHRRWPFWHQQAYEELRGEADEVVLVNDMDYSPEAMHRRNEWMVDRCHLLVAVWNGKPRGGTYQCVGYAYRKGVNVYVLDPVTYRGYRLQNLAVK